MSGVQPRRARRAAERYPFALLSREGESFVVALEGRPARQVDKQIRSAVERYAVRRGSGLRVRIESAPSFVVVTRGPDHVPDPDAARARLAALDALSRRRALSEAESVQLERLLRYVDRLGRRVPV